jgi:dihydrofolate synthase/folylpolyglutamate synthase
MAASLSALTEAFDFTDLVAIIAVSEDKDVPGILGELEPVAAHLVVTSNSSTRSMPVAALAVIAEAVFGPDRVSAAERLDEAIDIGVALADAADAAGAGGPGKAGVLITGSVITAGDARVLLTEKAGNGADWADSPAHDLGPGGDAG